MNYHLGCPVLIPNQTVYGLCRTKWKWDRSSPSLSCSLVTITAQMLHTRHLETTLIGRTRGEALKPSQKGIFFQISGSIGQESTFALFFVIKDLTKKNRLK